RFALRALRKSPGFAAVTVLSLALGIGANTAIFQLLDAVHLRPLPLRDAAQLATVNIANRTWRTGSSDSWHADLSYALWEQIRDRQQGFSSVFAWGDRTFNTAPGGQARWTRGIEVSGGYFDILRVPPAAGRVLAAADDRRGCPGAAVLSHAYWQRAYG